MKTIITTITVLLLSLTMTSCHKKDCERAQERLTNAGHQWNQAIYDYQMNSNASTEADLDRALQELNQANLNVERSCK